MAESADRIVMCPRSGWLRTVAIIAFCAASVGSPFSKVNAKSGDIELTVYSRTVFWTATPNTTIDAELLDGSTLKATAAAQTGTDGSVRLFFQPQAVHGNPYLLPGNVVVMSEPNHLPIRVTVPDLSVAVDSGSRRIFGIAPQGPELSIEIEQSDGSNPPTMLNLGKASVAPDGRYDFAVPADAPWSPGNQGTVAFRNADGDLFKAAFGVPSVTATIGRSYLEGVGSPGLVIANELWSPVNSASSRIQTSLMNKPRWIQGLPPGITVQPGVWITTTFSHQKLNANYVIAAQVPTLTLRASPKTNVIEGVAPPGQVVTVEAGPPGAIEAGAPTFHAMLHVGTDGRFAVTPITVTLTPGWQIAISLEVVPGFTVRTATAIRLFRVQVFGDRVDGNFGLADTKTTVTLLSSAGVSKAKVEMTSTHDGSFWFSAGTFTGQGGEVIEPGDSLQIETALADPVLIRVPPMSAKASVDTDTISGTGPRGALVTVTAPVTHAVETMVDPDGNFNASLAGIQDLLPGMEGTVTFTDASGYEYQLKWVATRILVRLHENYVRGFAAVGQAISARVLYADGRLAGTGWRSPSTQGSNFALQIADSAGQPVTMESGERIQLEVMNQLTEMVLPPLYARVDAGEDRADGFSASNVTVTLSVRKAGLADKFSAPERFRTRTDADGRYSFRLAGVFDLRYNDTFTLSTTTPDSHFVQVDVPGGGFKVELGAGTVSGSVDAHEPVTLTLQRTGSAVRVFRSQGGPDDSYTITIPKEPSGSAPLMAGDEIRATHYVSGSVVSENLVIPVLEVRPNLNTQTIIGMASPGGTLDLNISPLFRRDSMDYTSAAIAPIQADSSFSVPLSNFGPRARLGPGQQVEADYWLPSGNLIIRKIPLPSLSIEVGGAAVCGFGLPGDRILLDLLNDHKVAVGTALATIPGDGRFRLLIKDSKGLPVPIVAGSTLQSSFGVSTTTIAIPSLQVRAAWSSNVPGWAFAQTILSGTGPRFSPYYITVPGTDCFSDATSAVVQYVRSGETQSGGSLFANVDEFSPGGDVLVAVDTPEGYRVHRRLVRPQVTIFVNTDRVEGVATSFSAVSVEHHDANGQLIASGSVVSDVDSRFTIHLTETTGAKSRITPGSSVVLISEGDTTSIVVEGVDFDFSSSTGLDGVAPPDRQIEIEFTVRDGRRLIVRTRSDHDGKFRYHAEDLPIIRSWDLVDVKHVLVRCATPNHHYLGVETDVGTGMPPAPRPVIFLPTVKRGVR